MAHEQIEENLRRLESHSDASMERAAAAALDWVDTLPNSDFYIHEASPNAAGTGHPVQAAHIKQFPGDGEPFVPEDGAPAGDGATTASKAPKPATA